jgi:N-acetylneuraminate epimerase
MLITESAFAQKAKLPSVEWTLAAELKDSDGNRSLGFAGAINAIDNDVLIVAGGANFPNKMPWDGGKKHYSNEIHVLQKTTEGYFWNKAVKTKLPESIGYCGYTSTPQGIVYAGGENNNGFSNRVYLLNWDDASEDVIIKQLPNLPVAITNIALTNIGHIVYAVGGDLQNKSSNAFLSLDLSKENARWENMPNLPVALANTVVVVQQYNHGKGIYMIGGRAKTSSGISNLYHSTFVFDFEKQKWRDAAPISDGKNVTNFSAGAGVAIGDHFILITGGDDGKTFNKIENYLSQIAKSSNDELKRKLTKQKNELNINHKGFYRGMLLYSTLTNTWTKIGDLPFLAQVTTKATLWDGKIVLSNGEVKPGIRTPNVMLGTIKQ